MEVAAAAATRVSVRTVQSSCLPPRLSTQFSSSSCYLSSTSNAPFPFRSNTSCFPLKASSFDNPKPVSAEIKRMKNEEDSSELDRLFEEKVSVFNKYMSNYGLMRSLVLVQIKWLIKLSQIPQVTIVPSLSEKSLSFLEGLIDDFDSDDDYRNVAWYARSSATVVEAVILFLIDKSQIHPEVEKAVRCSAHASTHEDLMKLSYAFSLKEAINKVMLPVMDDLIIALCKMAKDNADVPILCRTGDKPASTTLGKEISIFAARLSNERHRLSKVAILGDFAGFSGNHSANVVAYPELDWEQIAKQFVEESLELTFNPYVRFEPHDYMVDLVYAIKRFSAILVHFFEDVESYTSVGVFNQISEADEFMSLTTPNKVNHLDQITEFRDDRSFFVHEEIDWVYYFDRFLQKNPHIDTEINEFGWSSSTLYDYNFGEVTAKLIIKKMAEVLKSYLLSYKVALLGIEKLQVNKTCLTDDMDDLGWGMLLEPVESVMERYGEPSPRRYAGLFQSDDITEVVFKESISDNLAIPEFVKPYLLELTQRDYIGEAASIAVDCVDKIVHDLRTTADDM